MVVIFGIFRSVCTILDNKKLVVYFEKAFFKITLKLISSYFTYLM